MASAHNKILHIGGLFQHLLQNAEDMEDETTQRTRLSKRLQSLAAEVQELIKQPCVNLKNHGITDLELIRVVLPVLESKIAQAKFVAIDLSFNQLTPLCAKEFARVLTVCRPR